MLRKAIAVSCLGFALVGHAVAAEGAGRCTAPALAKPESVLAKPQAARPLSAETYARHYGPRQAARSADAALNSGACAGNTQFLIGAGKGDVTGPVHDLVMAGYANPVQVSAGLRDRQMARAFIIAPSCAPAQKVAMVSVDLGLMYHGVRQEAMKRLAPDFTYENLMIGATHSHSTAAGQSHHDLINLPGGGHDAQAFEALVSGIVEAVKAAEADFAAATPGPITFAQSELLNTSVQRSAEAYDLNPADERAAWVDEAGSPVTINRNAITLMLNGAGGAKGLMNFFGVHVTSFSSANTQLSGDNKGWAAWLVEHEKDAGFVAAFFQADEGDSSPNIHMDGITDWEMRMLTSEPFLSRGGGRDDAESTFMSAYKQATHAMQDAEAADQPLRGGVGVAHAFIDLPNAYVEANPAHRTCTPAYGLSAAAGAEDGRALLNEGWRCSDTSGFVQWLSKMGLSAMVRFGFGQAVPEGMLDNMGCTPAREAPTGPYGCHGEKPILGALGYGFEGSDQPLIAQVVPMQIITLGNLAVVALPFEVTTMSARRIRAAVLDELQGAGVQYAVVSGLANGYSHYLTTPEEYDLQLYEGGSTVFGRHQLDVVLQEVRRLAGDLKAGRSIPSSPFAVAKFESHVTPLVHEPDMVADHGPADVPPGTLLADAAETYQVGDEAPLSVTIRAINPRLSAHGRDIHMAVERLGDDGTWAVTNDETAPSTRLVYVADEGALRAEWLPYIGTKSGTYRLRVWQGDGAEIAASSREIALIGCQ